MNLHILEVIQNLPDSLKPVMTFFSLLGHGEFYLVICVIILWFIEPKKGLYFALAIATTTLSTEGLKIILQQSRPDAIGTIIQDFGMPSAHASTAVVFCLYLSDFIRSKKYIFIAVSTVIIIGISRIYLNVHFPFQILVGFSYGFLLYLITSKVIKDQYKIYLLMAIVFSFIAFVIWHIKGVGFENLKHTIQVSGLIIGLVFTGINTKNPPHILTNKMMMKWVKLFSLVLVMAVFIFLKSNIDTIHNLNLFLLAHFFLHCLLALTLSTFSPIFFNKISKFV